MKNLKTNKTTESMNPFLKFNLLLKGSKSSIAANIFLIGFSLVLMYYTRQSLLSITFSCIGIAVLVLYTFKFLRIKNIEQKTDSTVLFSSNISKFKTYMGKRKKNEIIYMSVWMLSTIPAVTILLASQAKAFVIVAFAILLMAVVGYFSFKKVDSEIESLEAFAAE